MTRHSQTPAVKAENDQARADKAENDKLQDTVNFLSKRLDDQARDSKADNDKLQATIDKHFLVTQSLSETAMANKERNEQLQASIGKVEEQHDKVIHGLGLHDDKLEAGLEKMREASARADDVNNDALHEQIDTLNDNYDVLRQSVSQLVTDGGKVQAEIEAKKVDELEKDANHKQLSDVVDKLQHKVQGLQDKVEMVAKDEQEEHEALHARLDNYVDIVQEIDSLGQNNHDLLVRVANLVKVVDQGFSEVRESHEQSQADIVVIGAMISANNKENASVVKKRLQEFNTINDRMLDDIHGKVSRIETSMKEEAVRSKDLREDSKELYIKFGRFEKAQEETQTQLKIMAAKPSFDSSEQATDDKIPPPLIVLNGLLCQRDGFIKDNEGKLVGQLFLGDPKQFHRLDSRCDAHGGVYRSSHPNSLVGRARTLTPFEVKCLQTKEDKEGADLTENV